MTDLFTNLKTALLTMPVTTTIGSTATTIRAWNGWQRLSQFSGQTAYPCLIVEIDEETEQNNLNATPQFVISDVVITSRDNTDSGSQALHSTLRGSLGGYSGNGFTAILDSTKIASTPKNDGSGNHWYDRVSSWTFLYPS